MLGNQDLNGFNLGVATYKVNHRLVTYLSRILAMEYHKVEPESSIKEQPQYAVLTLSDQYASALMIENYKDVQERFYEIPQDWWSSYHHPGTFPNVTDADPEVKTRGGIHLAGTLKYDWDWKEFLRIPEKVYDDAARLASAMGIEGNGLDMMPSAVMAREVAAEWWRSHGSGIDNMTFNDI